jgi:histidinol-phosphate/aromatic aminotransferase/cobyric acid decarboxylase-like protein
VDRLAQYVAEIALKDRGYFEKTKDEIIAVREKVL